MQLNHSTTPAIQHYYLCAFRGMTQAKAVGLFEAYQNDNGVLFFQPSQIKKMICSAFGFAPHHTKNAKKTNKIKFIFKLNLITKQWSLSLFTSPLF